MIHRGYLLLANRKFHGLQRLHLEENEPLVERPIERAYSFSGSVLVEQTFMYRRSVKAPGLAMLL